MARCLPQAGKSKWFVSPTFLPYSMLNPEEIDDLVEFLENGLYDPDMQRYVPVKTQSGNCFPNNDHFSKVDMKCD
jgi:cytochrome c peroxidase